MTGSTGNCARSPTPWPGVSSTTTGASSSPCPTMQRPGPIVGEKEGLAAERDCLAGWWREERRSCCCTSLTSCLRIGDATSFKQVGR